MPFSLVVSFVILLFLLIELRENRNIRFFLIGLAALALAYPSLTGFNPTEADVSNPPDSSYLIAAGMVVLLSTTSVTGLYVGCILFGFGVGNLITLPGLIVQQEFPRRDFARAVSFNVAITQLVDKPTMGVHVKMPKSIFTRQPVRRRGT